MYKVTVVYGASRVVDER